MGSCVMSTSTTETILNELGNNEIKIIEQIPYVDKKIGRNELLRKQLAQQANDNHHLVIIDEGKENMFLSFGDPQRGDDTDEKTISMLNSDYDDDDEEVMISSSEGQSLIEIKENALNISQSKNPKTLRSLMYSKKPLKPIQILRSISSDNNVNSSLKSKDSFKINARYKFIFESDKPKYINQRSRILDTTNDISGRGHNSSRVIH